MKNRLFSAREVLLEPSSVEMLEDCKYEGSFGNSYGFLKTLNCFGIKLEDGKLFSSTKLLAELD